MDSARAISFVTLGTRDLSTLRSFYRSWGWAETRRRQATSEGYGRTMTRPTLGGVWLLAQSDNTLTAERIAICFAGVCAILLGVQLVRRRRSLAHELASSARQFRARNADSMYDGQLRAALVAVPVFGVWFMALGLVAFWKGLRG